MNQILDLSTRQEARCGARRPVGTVPTPTTSNRLWNLCEFQEDGDEDSSQIPLLIPLFTYMNCGDLPSSEGFAQNHMKTTGKVPTRLREACTCARNFLTAVESARVCDLTKWSPRTCERAFGWASYMQKLAQELSDDEIHIVFDVLANQENWVGDHAGRRRVPEALASRRVSFLREGKKFLLDTMLASPFLKNGARKWLVFTLVSREDYDEQEVESKLLVQKQIASQRKIMRKENSEIDKTTEGQKVFGGCLRNKTYAKIWQVKTMSERDLKVLAHALLQSGVNGDYEGETRTFQNWVTDKLLKDPLKLWAHLHDSMLLDLSRMKLKFALQYLSHLLVRASVEAKLTQNGNSGIERIRSFCKKAPWMKLLCKDVLASSKEHFAHELLKRITSSKPQ